MHNEIKKYSLMGTVIAVSISKKHTFSKKNQNIIKLVKGLGIEGDAHFGSTIKHRSRVAQNPDQPNLRQVHLIHSELFEELADRFHIEPGQMGENITTAGINLLELPAESILFIGTSAAIQVTGLRNPCAQIDQFHPGLLKAVIDQDGDGNLIRKAGIMGVVLESGEVKPGDEIHVVLPPKPFKKLERV
ncbi:MOSC domain-containing protein [Cytobacillus firmus]|uniref:MOSC domain-containing protein n=1 Tax=Cytobacillus firmus TaxID=1399 RepID=UPI002161A872|nr:MOSC domain-containing protein [Cytobacillus firmus]MCS0673590.1 MOSC domain-containing protein [Cytobacillus firmus]